MVKHEHTGKEHEMHVRLVAKVTWGTKYEDGRESKSKEPEEWDHEDINLSGIKNEDIMVDDVIVFTYM